MRYQWRVVALSIVLIVAAAVVVANDVEAQALLPISAGATPQVIWAPASPINASTTVSSPNLLPDPLYPNLACRGYYNAGAFATTPVLQLQIFYISVTGTLVSAVPLQFPFPSDPNNNTLYVNLEGFLGAIPNQAPFSSNQFYKLNLQNGNNTLVHSITCWKTASSVTRSYVRTDATNTVLGIGGIYAGNTIRDQFNLGRLWCVSLSDQASQANGFKIIGTTPAGASNIILAQMTTVANTPAILSITGTGESIIPHGTIGVNVSYTNGGTGQGSFQLECFYESRSY